MIKKKQCQFCKCFVKVESENEEQDAYDVLLEKNVAEEEIRDDD